MSIFEKLNAINVNGHTEEKNGLTYLSWRWAWAEVKKAYPDAEYSIMKFNGLPFVFDENTGYMVYTTVTIEGKTHEMWLPVMDGANKAMKAQPYEYTVKNPSFKYAKLDKSTGKYIDGYGREQREYNTKTCEAATMFDINKTIMRCLVKNLAMFGLGLYIYAGEDLPESEENDDNRQNMSNENKSAKQPKPKQQKKEEQEQQNKEEPKQESQTPPGIHCSVCGKLLTVDYANKVREHYGTVVCSRACAEKAGIAI